MATPTRPLPTPKLHFTFEEAAEELGLANSGEVSKMFQRAGVFVKKEQILPTDGKGRRLLTEQQLKSLKALGHTKGNKYTKKQKTQIRLIVRGGETEMPILKPAKPEHVEVVASAKLPPAPSARAEAIPDLLDAAKLVADFQVSKVLNAKTPEEQAAVAREFIAIKLAIKNAVARVEGR